jgi:hypothetical protein
MPAIRSLVGPVLIAMAPLTACAAQPSDSVQSIVPSGLSAASAGLCDALAALPDAQAAERSFTNGAHDALHALAADDRLDRSMAAGVLEAMQRLESDLDQAADTDRLSDDLHALKDSTDTALQSVGEEVAACDS